MRGQEIAKEGGYYMDKYFLDGQYVAQFFAGGIASGLLQGNSQLPMQSETWEMQTDGSLIIIGHENFQENKRGGVVKRVKITPDAGTSIATWIAGANESKPAVSNQNARQNPVVTTQGRNPQTSNTNSIPAVGQQPAPSVIQTNADTVTATNVVDKVNKAANATKAAADSLKRLFGK
jgi:hypothetical protein